MIGVGIVIAGVAHAAEASPAGTDVRLQDRLHAIAQRQVGVTHNPGGNARYTEDPARAHRRDAIDELGLADRT